jgi:hypothetical protein
MEQQRLAQTLRRGATRISVDDMTGDIYNSDGSLEQGVTSSCAKIRLSNSIHGAFSYSLETLNKILSAEISRNPRTWLWQRCGTPVHQLITPPSIGGAAQAEQAPDLTVCWKANPYWVGTVLTPLFSKSLQL